MRVKSFLLFISGIAFGGTAGVLGTKKYFEDKYQKRYEDDHRALEEYYNRTDEYVRASYDNEEEEDDRINPLDADEESRPNGRMSKEERDEIKKKLSRNWEGTTNYAAMYKKQNAVEDASNETSDEHICCGNCINYNYEDLTCCLDPDNPREVNYQYDSCEEFEEYLNDSDPEEEVFEEYQKNKDRPPKIISASAFSELNPSVDTEVLYFYAYDEMLCDENEEPITEPAAIVGDCLDKYGFRDNEERIIFVMNYAINTAYEIQKVDASWTETH